MKKIIYIFSLLLVLSPTGFCYEKSDLKKVEKQISQHRQISKKLVKEVKNTEKQLKDIRSKSIKIAKSIQANENSINSIKEDMNDLTASIKIKEMQLEKNKQNSIAILSSIRRISSMPTDGFILASKNPQDLINTRVLINSVLPNLINQAKKLNKDIKEIEESKQSVLDKKDKLLSLNKSKEKEMKEIKKLLKEKMAIKSKLTSKQRREKAELNKLAKKASSIKDFVKKLQSRKVKSKPGLKPSKKITSTKPKSDVKFSGRKGNMPIAGKIVLGYGKKNAQNVTNYGWEMKGNIKGLVTCPIDGEVLYSGEFGSYDNIVVFDNGAGYNLLLAGMGKVGINVGDKVQAGEPIGFLKSTRLYVELRKDGKLINPKRVIK